MELKPVGTVTKNEELRQARLKRHWTQRRLAEELNAAVDTVRAWERGTNYPSLEMQERIREVLGIELPATREITEDTHSQETATSPLVSVLPFPPPGKTVLTRGDKNRLRMLKRVEMRWISVLKHSLYRRSLILLSLKELPEGVKNPWSEVVQASRL